MYKFQMDTIISSNNLDTIKIIQPIIRLLQIFGFYPISIVKENLPKKLQLKRFPIILTYSISITFISLICLIISIINKDKLLESKFQSVLGKVDMIQLCGIQVAFCVTLLESIIKYQKQFKLINKIKEIDYLFEENFGIELNLTSFGNRICLFTFGVLTFYLLNHVLQFGMAYDPNGNPLPFYMFLYIIPFFGCGLRYLQIIVFMKIITLKLTKINQLISEIKLTKDTALNRYLNIKLIYDKLWNIINLVNDCFGFSLLINITYDFITITGNCYYLYKAFTDKTNSSEYANEIFACICWAIPSFLNVILLTATCNETIEMIKETSMVVQRSSYNTINVKQDVFIDRFLLHLMVQQVNITANGFFIIDYSLLVKIASATTTYLVILIQFG